MNTAAFIFASAIIVSMAGQTTLAFEAVKGFDTDEGARFNSVSVPVGLVQSSKDLKSESAPDKKSHWAKHSYFDKVVAIGLSPNEMKNLNVESGALLEVESGATQVMASVYLVTGDASPPLATINLSPAAAAKLKVKPGDVVVVHHLGDESLPEVTQKHSTIDISTRTDDSNL